MEYSSKIHQALPLSLEDLDRLPAHDVIGEGKVRQRDRGIASDVRLPGFQFARWLSPISRMLDGTTIFRRHVVG